MYNIRFVKAFDCEKAECEITTRVIMSSSVKWCGSFRPQQGKGVATI